MSGAKKLEIKLLTDEEAKKLDPNINQEGFENFTNEMLTMADELIVLEKEIKRQEKKEAEVQDLSVLLGEELKLNVQSVKMKSGEIMSKKRPLISKDHERAYLNSADRALEKPARQQTQYRKFQYAPSEDEGGGDAPSEVAATKE